MTDIDAFDINKNHNNSENNDINKLDYLLSKPKKDKHKFSKYINDNQEQYNDKEACTISAITGCVPTSLHHINKKYIFVIVLLFIILTNPYTHLLIKNILNKNDIKFIIYVINSIIFMIFVIISSYYF
jgi:hypothetical protein